MKSVVSEVRLLLAFVLLVGGISILANVKLFSEPGLVSELAVGLSAIAVILILFSVVLFRRSMISGNQADHSQK